MGIASFAIDATGCILQLLQTQIWVAIRQS